MRKTAVIAMALAAVLAVAGVAFASNTYTTTGSITPVKSGTKKAPKAVKTVFKFNVGTTDNTRPSIIVTYSIKFGGLKSFGKKFKNCSFAQVTAAAGPASACSKALVGTGNIENQLGGDTDTAAANQLACHVDLREYNLPNNHLALRLDGGPTNPKGACVASIASAIDAKFVPSSSGDSLQFSVPTGLQHPIPGLSNAVVETASTISAKTTKITIGKKKVKVGLLSSVSCPKSKKRPITVTYTAADGSKTHSSATTPCKS